MGKVGCFSKLTFFSLKANEPTQTIVIYTWTVVFIFVVVLITF